MSTPTLEARWFVRGPVPPAVAAWADAIGLGAPEARTDRYLVAPTDALGLKVRGGRVEAKEHTGPAVALRAGRSEGASEPWRKWAFLLAPAPGGGPRSGGFAGETDGWVDVDKRRRLRRDPCPAGGVCTVELTEVEVRGDAWWSVCFEAAGPTAAARKAALDATVAQWLDRADAPAFRGDDAVGYPAWLRRAARMHGGAAPDGTAPHRAPAESPASRR